MEKEEKKINIKTLLSYEAKYLILYFLCMFLSVASLEGSLVVIKNFIDHMAADSQGVKVSVYVAPIILAFFLATLFLILRSQLKSKLLSRISSRLTKASLQSLLSSDIYENNLVDKEECIKNIVKNANEITYYYIDKNLLQFIETLIILFTCLFSTFFIYLLGGLTLLLITPFFIVIERILVVITWKSKKQYNEELDLKQQLFNKTYENIVEVKLKNGKDKVLDSFENIDHEQNELFHLKSFSSDLANSILLVITIGITLSISYGVGVAWNFNNLSIGKLVYMSFITPIFFIVLHYTMHANLARTDISKAESELYDMIHLKEEDNNKKINKIEDIYSINFSNVSYSYLNNDEKDNLLNNLDFDIKKGEKIGIYSLDHEEKDAIFESFSRIRKYNSGKILINNNEIDKINIDYLRSIITSLSYKDEVPSGTISNIISYPYNYDDYKYNDAINKSGLRDFINSLDDKGNTYISKDIIEEKGYDSFIETRIILANAIYRDTKIYLCNDFCHDSDSFLENEVIDVLFNLKGKLIILLTDHIYLLNKCDKVLIIKDGKVLEYGKTNELINNKDSEYYKLLKKNR